MVRTRVPPGDMGITRNGIIILPREGIALDLRWLPSRRLIPNPTRLIQVTPTQQHQVPPIMAMVIPNHTTVAVSMEPRLVEALTVMPRHRLRRTLTTIVTTIIHRIIPPSLRIPPMVPTMVNLRVVTMILTLLTRSIATIVDMKMDTTQ